MKNMRFCAILVFSLLTPLIYATDIVHSFATSSPGIVYESPSFKRATTSDGYTYTCGNSAVFGVVSSQIMLNLNDSDDYVVLSPAVEDLVEVRIYYSTKNTSLRVYISDDGSTWGDPLPESRMDYKAAYVKAKIPKGKRYVKIVNTSGAEVNISQITYTPTDCNCFEYIPE